MTAEELAACVAESITQASTLFIGTLDEPVRRHAAHVVADTIGVSIAGGRTAEMTRLRENADELGGAVPGTGGATVLVAGAAPVSAEQAAFLNGAAGGFLELDEGTRPTGHPAMHIVPAALAAAEVAHRPGTELLEAVVAGYEVSARLFAAFQLRPPTHPHGHLAGVGAAVSVALLLGEDPAAVAAIAATTPTVPVWNACYAGATARNTAMGLSAQAALRAIRLHRAGFTGTLESVPALFGEVTGKPVDIDALTAAADPARPRILRNYFKRHSACALTHGAVDAVLSMPAVPVDSIRSVEVRTVANNLKLDRQAAPNDLSARFSLPYTVAAALTRRESTPATFDYDPTVARLAEKVRVTLASELDRSWPEHAPTEVVVHAQGSVAATVQDPRGHHHDPLSADELRAKFTDLVGDIAPELWDRLLGLAALDDCAEALRPLRLVKPV
ncbi:MmgE/PrpD family protein [Saccharopolyspora sp. K220]|uniref:MmgE/PrpD family protein n=1 Tax=Saccharopolyspora soli TaxID=2926618 RepID=UPI001F58662D|nr:MmgE/PrpD family protein [Saccharopolyspora soli]MCI2419741.1 MmgE/PrpD family protein [Saccharopolyspora soli]